MDGIWRSDAILWTKKKKKKRKGTDVSSILRDTGIDTEQ